MSLLKQNVAEYSVALRPNLEPSSVRYRPSMPVSSFFHICPDPMHPTEQNLFPTLEYGESNKRICGG